MSGAGEIVSIAASAVVVLGALLGIIRWFIHQEVHPVKAEMQPNGGGSFRDHIDHRFDALDDRLNGLDERLTITEDRVFHRVRYRD